MKIVITANGKGSRMSKYGQPKFLLPYKGKRIIDWLYAVFNKPYILTHHNIDLPYIKCNPTETRKQTLEYISDWENVLIVDCDIYIEQFTHKPLKETLYICNGINAGLYYVESIATLLTNMQGDDIVSGMNNFDIVELKTKHLGTPFDYIS